MGRAHSTYVCQSCGAVHPRWSGRCDACGAWNAIAEEPASPAPRERRKAKPLALERLSGPTAEAARQTTGIGELDRVMGGGLVAGAVTLVGGDPGIGKSTLLLQAAAALARKGAGVTYISGEESLAQLRLRAQRLGLADTAVAIATETSLSKILATLEADAPPTLLVIDSIQTLWSEVMESAPGTVGQVRACAQELVRFAKRKGTAVILIGHVTKDGQIAGPRVVEHMVDTVLYFEGERGHAFRILRAVKNRFGPTDEIGVFEMSDRGLVEVGNPSALFLGVRDAAAPGTAVFAGIEGTRPLLVEIQTLIAPCAYGTPRRAVVGADSARLAMVLAVLEARCGVAFGGRDVFVNVAGGLRITEPAADLAVAAALLSCLTEEPLPVDCVVFGEVSLSGALRPVSQAEARLKEAQKLGFRRAILPAEGKLAGAGLSLDTHESLASLAARFDLAQKRTPLGRRVLT